MAKPAKRQPTPRKAPPRAAPARARTAPPKGPTGPVGKKPATVAGGKPQASAAPLAPLQAQPVKGPLTPVLQPGTALPPREEATPAQFPIAVHPQRNDLAPSPVVDRYPIIIGQNLTATYMSAVYRLATTGYRQQYVDVLNELLEVDANLQAVLVKRFFSSANGRLEILPADLPEGHKDTDLAKQLAQFVNTEVSRIPDMTQFIANMMWGLYHGISAAQIFWTVDTDGWHVDRFGFIHTRRLSYPDGASWSLHIWDQGQVYGWSSGWGDSPTNSNVFGLRIEDWPGKFIVYAPQLRADYPTREGLGRALAMTALFKRLAMRNSLMYLERFSKPFMDISYSTREDGHPREAENEDINKASEIGATIGPGGGSYAVHPDSVKIEHKAADGGGSSKLGFLEFIQFMNAEEAKLALGGTLGTDVGKGGGNRALGEVQERGEVDIEQFDATTFSEAFRRDVVTWLVRLNRPDCMHLVPRVMLHVDTDPDPKSIIAMAKEATAIGVPLDADDLAEKAGLKVVPNTQKGDDGQPKPRMTFMADVVAPTDVHDNLLSDDAKARQEQDRQDKLDTAKAAAEAKAKAPAVAIPGAAAAGAAKPKPAGTEAPKKPTTK